MINKKFDVIIVGAGLSGISAARHLQMLSPNKTFVLLESRERIGGTWDLFRYPGVRSDSDMFTLGYSFKPWTDKKSIARGETIRDYIIETAKDYNIEQHIRFNNKVKSARWTTSNATWEMDVEQKDGSIEKISSNFVMMCSGYYSYSKPFLPEFPGRDDFKGDIIHPQFWPENYDYSDKKVVIIGSGATAVTMVPAMTDKAKHVTMLQRSPTYMVSGPSEDHLANTMRKILPAKMAYATTRWMKVMGGLFFFNISRKYPQRISRLLTGLVKKQLPPEVDFKKHFIPKYNPWDQRLCLVTDADLFKALRAGKASMVTDQIETFTPGGIKLKSGEMLEADLIITATGLNMVLMGEVDFQVDGKKVEISTSLLYKGAMFSGVPNLTNAMGYTNSSFTLKTDLICKYVNRILNYMDKNKLDYCVPELHDANIEINNFVEFSSGYILRALNTLPKQGVKAPWKVYQHYFKDMFQLKVKSLHDEALKFYKVQKNAEINSVKVNIARGM